MATKLASVSVDLDEIHHYFEIHGLTASGSSRSLTLVYDVAMARLRALADAGRFPLTFFAIGRDLDRPKAGAELRAAAGEGHEIANHSLDHRYDLVRLGREEIERQVEDGAVVIERACGERPVGFRAPGYTITDEVFDVLKETGARYDASVFPCPSYWALKAGIIALISLRGRRSHSIIGSPEVLRAPTQPYRVGTPYWKRGSSGGLLEIPVQVTRGPRLPFIGTTLTMAGPTRARWLTKLCAGEPLVNLELHGIDVLDATDGLEALAAHQHDVRVPRQRKMDSILAAIEELRRAGYSFVTMREAAAAF